MRFVVQDLRQSLRGLRKAPGFAAIALVTLGLGIGANSAIFTLIHTIYLKPLPYADSGRLVKVGQKGKSGEVGLSYLDYREWLPQAAAFESIAVRSAAPVTRAAATGAERVAMFCVSGNFFGTLGVAAQSGRVFTPAEDSPAAPLVAVLTHRYWISAFGGDAGALGRPLTLNGKAYTIAGVLPAWFHFDPGADLYVPIVSVREFLFLDRPENHSLYAVGKLKPGVTRQQALAQLETIARRGAAQSKEKDPPAGAALTPLRRDVKRDMQDRYLILLGAVALVLLIACVNVANLMLARSASRRKEMAVRAAMGAGRWRIARQLLTESVALSVAAALVGVVLASWMMDGLAALLPRRFVPQDLAIDTSVLLFTLAVACLTGVLFGLAPAVQAARVSLSEAMKDPRNEAAPAGRSRLRSGLVVAELAMATVLLIGAGLLLGSFRQVTRTDPGYRTENMVVMSVDWPSSDPLSYARIWPFYRGIIERVRQLPQVTAAAGGPTPLRGAAHLSPVHIDNRPGKPAQAAFLGATAEYFETMGMALRKGRPSTEADAGWPQAKSRQELVAKFMKMHFVAVVNETMARTVWPGEDPLGKTFRWYGASGPVTEVIGVVADVHLFQVEREPEPAYFIPETQYPLPLTLLVRSRAGTEATVAAVKRIVKEADPSAPVTDIATLDQVAAESLAPRRTNLILFGSFAVLALALAFVGVYGVVSYSVVRRTHEIGIRMALGASRQRVVRNVVRQSALLGAAGVAAGCAAALPLTRLLASMLFGVGPTDPATFVAVSALLLAVTALAGYLPARRATRLDPVTALRTE